MHWPDQYSEVQEVIQQIFDEHSEPLWLLMDHMGVRQPRLLHRVCPEKVVVQVRRSLRISLDYEKSEWPYLEDFGRVEPFKVEN